MNQSFYNSDLAKAVLLVLYIQESDAKVHVININK